MGLEVVASAPKGCVTCSENCVLLLANTRARGLRSRKFAGMGGVGSS